MSTVYFVSSTNREQRRDRTSPLIQVQRADRRTIAVVAGLIGLSLFFSLAAAAQVSVTTYHYDNTRAGVNPRETLLTPANVVPNTFGLLFSNSVDGWIVGEPLYMANVTIPGQGVHNVVYVATLNDSVYAFDADTPSTTPLWHTSFATAPGVTAVPISVNGCTHIGYSQVGIMGTPVIDPATRTLYVSAKTQEVSGSTTTYVHRLHALDITTGQEKFGGPATISGSWTPPGTSETITFSALPQNQRPALMLLNSTVFVAFGSNGCDKDAYGWLFGFNASNLQQTPAIWSPASSAEILLPGDAGGASFWQSGSGLAADAQGNIFVTTANGQFDVNEGGSDYADSVVKLAGGFTGITLQDYFTPFDQANLQTVDSDLGSGGVALLPPQPGAHPNEMITAGKGGSIYVLDRDSLGGYNPVDNSQIPQSLQTVLGSFRSVPEYWNGFVYFFALSDSLKQYTLTNGLLSSTPTATALTNAGGVPLISSNLSSNGLIWTLTNSPNTVLSALNATNLVTTYDSTLAGTRDLLGSVAHFSTPTVVNGKVFVGAYQGTNTTGNLMAYGLLPVFAVTGGNHQSGRPGTTLPVALSVKAKNSYNGNPIAGVTVNFSDGGKGGSFSNPNPVTGSNGIATTNYTLPPTPGTVAITASATGYVSIGFGETANAGSPSSIRFVAGGGQRATVGTVLPKALVASVLDGSGNPLPNISVNFSDGGVGGSFSANPVITGNNGQASVQYTLPTTAQRITVTASVTGLTQTASATEQANPGPPATSTVFSGDRQAGNPSTKLPKPLVVVVKDQFGNVISGVTVNFSDNGAGGTLSNPVATTDANGQASTTYTLPSQSGVVINVTGTVTGLTPASFTERTK